MRGFGRLFSDLVHDETRRQHEVARIEPTKFATASRAGDSKGVELAGLYIISVAARLTAMHPQTLRKYERFGLVQPSRTSGSLRLYSEQDLVRLRLIRTLVHRFDLNLAGVRLVMAMVAHVREALDEMESGEEILRTREGQAAVVELRGLLRFVGAG